MVLDLVVDGHRQLLDPGGDRLQDEVTDDPAICHCHEALASLVISRRVRPSLLLTDAAACAVESEEATVLRKVGVETLQLGRVSRSDPAHTDIIANHVLIVPGDALRSECRASHPEGAVRPFRETVIRQVVGAPRELALLSKMESTSGRPQVIAEVWVRDRDQRACSLGHRSAE